MTEERQAARSLRSSRYCRSLCSLPFSTSLSRYVLSAYGSVPYETRRPKGGETRKEREEPWKAVGTVSRHFPTSFLASYSRLFTLLSLGDRSFAPHVTLRPSHLLPVGTRRETTSVTREVTRRVTDMEAGWEGSFIAFATRALHAPPTSHKKSEETE